MNVTFELVRASRSQFSGMRGMVDAIKGANRKALEQIFFVLYCIVAVGASVEAAHILFNVYGELGFTEQECIAILEKMTGKKQSDL